MRTELEKASARQDGRNAMIKRISETGKIPARDEFNKMYKPGKPFPSSMSLYERLFALGQFSALNNKQAWDS